MDAELLTSALKGLIAAGPCTAVLSLLCWGLWKKLEKAEEKLERQGAEFIGFLRNALKGDFDGDGKPG